MIFPGTMVWLKAGIFFKLNDTYWPSRAKKKKRNKISLGDKEE